MKTALKERREKSGLTQVEVANKAKTTVRSYQYYESGERVPNAYTAQLIAEALNCELREIFPTKV